MLLSQEPSLPVACTCIIILLTCNTKVEGDNNKTDRRYYTKFEHFTIVSSVRLCGKLMVNASFRVLGFFIPPFWLFFMIYVY